MEGKFTNAVIAVRILHHASIWGKFICVCQAKGWLPPCPWTFFLIFECLNHMVSQSLPHEPIKWNVVSSIMMSGGAGFSHYAGSVHVLVVLVYFLSTVVPVHLQFIRVGSPPHRLPFNTTYSEVCCCSTDSGHNMQTWGDLNKGLPYNILINEGQHWGPLGPEWLVTGWSTF